MARDPVGARLSAAVPVAGRLAKLGELAKRVDPVIEDENA